MWPTCKERVTVLTQDTVKEYVKKQRFSGSHRLPSERELASLLKCSRMTVSRAMAHLEAEGLIERRRGSGTYIVDNSRENRTHNIGVCLRLPYHSSDQHFLHIMRTLSKNAGNSNVHLQIFDNLIDRFDRNLQRNALMMSIDSGVVDGLLVVSRMPVEILGALKAKVPLAIINNNAFGYLNIPSVCTDYVQVGYLAAQHLLKNGHRNIAYVHGGPIKPDMQMQLAGMGCAFDANGLEPLKEDSIFDITQNFAIQKRRFHEHLRRKNPTALFARTDMIAANLVRYLDELGYRVPEDISVIGVGNFSWGQMPSIGLTTIDTRLGDACKIGLELIRKLAHGDKDMPASTTINPRLVTRNTVRQIQP